MAENWKPVVGFEGLYEVSDLGRVRTVERVVPSKSGFRTVRGRLRATNYRLRGYPAVHLTGGGNDALRTVHLLVLEAFRGPRPSAEHEGCHGDGVPTNNVLSNLRWGTKLENKADSFAHGTAVFGERVHTAKLTDEGVLEIRRDRRSTAEIARALGLHRSTVRRARNGQTWARAEVQHG